MCMYVHTRIYLGVQVYTDIHLTNIGSMSRTFSCLAWASKH